MNKLLKHSELYFTQYSMYTKFSVQNYILHFEGRKWTAKQSIHSNLTIYIFISII